MSSGRAVRAHPSSVPWLAIVLKTFPGAGIAHRGRSGRLAPGPREDTPGMQDLPLGRPVEAEIGFGGPPVGPLSTMQGAVDAARLEIAAGRDHLGIDGPVTIALDLAQIGRA